MIKLILAQVRVAMALLVCSIFLLNLSCVKPGIQTLNSATPTEVSPIIDLAQWDDSQWNWVDLKSNPREDLPLIHTYKKIPFMPPDYLSADYLLQEPYYLYLDSSNSISCIHTENRQIPWRVSFELLSNNVPVHSFQFLSMRIIEQEKVLLLFQLNENFQLLCLELSSGDTWWRNEISKEESNALEIIFSNLDFLLVASKGDQGIDSIVTLNSMNGQEIWSWKENLNYITCFEQELLAVTEKGVFVVKSLDTGKTLTPSAYTYQSSPYAWTIRNEGLDKEFMAKGLFLEAIRTEQDWRRYLKFQAPENELRDISPLLSKQNPSYTTLLLFSYEWQDTSYLSYCDLLSQNELWRIAVPLFKPFSNLNFLNSSRIYASKENSYLYMLFEDYSEGNDAEKASLFFINSNNGKLEWTIHSCFHAQLEITPYGLWCRYNSSTQNSFYYFDRILMLEPFKQEIIWNLASSNGIFKQNDPRFKPSNPLQDLWSLQNFYTPNDCLSGYMLVNPQNGKSISVFPKTPIESRSSQNSVYLTAISDKHVFIYDEKDRVIRQYELPMQR
jgi:hypothetical protein